MSFIVFIFAIELFSIKMKNKHIRLITFFALTFILVLQGIWLYNTYQLLDGEFKKNISNLFIISVENASMSQIENPIINFPGRKLEGFRVQNDHYVNNRVLQDWIYKEGRFPPISLENLDRLFNDEYKKSYKNLNYSFSITDSLGKQTDSFSHGQKNLNERFAYRETIQLRNIAPEYITLVIASPYKIIFGKMLLMLIGSVIVVLFVVYSLIWQIMIINRQDTIAKIREDFTHSMIHDLKNPISSIISGINSLKSGKLDDKPQVKAGYYSIMTKEGERMLRLINKVLELVNLDNAHAVVSKTAVNLSELLSELTKAYETNAAKPVHFHMELHGVENIYADRHYIYEVFDNLIDNAVKYSKENEDADISIASIQKENETQLSFKDLGIGIAEKDQKKIFQKFERSMAVIKNQKKISGFGLGLNFVYQVIKAHGGTIKINSRPGSYSEFIIHLPTGDCGLDPQ